MLRRNSPHASRLVSWGRFPRLVGGLGRGRCFCQHGSAGRVSTDQRSVCLAGIPKKQLWAAAAKPDQAITLVLCAVPVGWTATIADGRLTPEQEEILNLKPSEVRELTK
jgi:hypothetical protein